jgi:hypothetical protein
MGKASFLRRTVRKVLRGTSWFTSVARYNERFPRIFRAGKWHPSSEGSVWMNLFGMRTSPLSLVGTRRNKSRNNMQRLLRIEGLERKQLLAADVYVNDDWAVAMDNDMSGDLSTGDQVSSTDVGAPTGLIFGTDAFATIQGGIDNVDVAGNVHVLEGTYTENVTISTSLNLLGPNGGIAGWNTGARGNEAIVLADGTPDAQIDVSASGVVISGLTIDGNNGSAIRAVRVNEVDNVSVTDNIITGSERGVQYNGGASGNSGGVVDSNFITGQVLTGSWGTETYGVVAFDSSYASVTHNIMTDLDVGVFEQYFYQPNGAGNDNNVISNNSITASLLGYGTNERAEQAATTELSNNDITLDGTPFSTGVQLYNIYKADGISLSDNTITDADIGVYAYINGGSVSMSGDSIDGSGGTTGVFTTNFLSDFDIYATAYSSVPSTLTLGGVTINGYGTGVVVEDADADFDLDTVDDATGTVELNLGSGNSISGGVTGIRLDGPNALLTGDSFSDVELSGQSGDYITLANAAYGAAGVHTLEIDATAVIFDGAVGSAMDATQRAALGPTRRPSSMTKRSTSTRTAWTVRQLVRLSPRISTRRIR